MKGDPPHSLYEYYKLSAVIGSGYEWVVTVQVSQRVTVTVLFAWW